MGHTVNCQNCWDFAHGKESFTPKPEDLEAYKTRYQESLIADMRDPEYLEVTCPLHGETP